MTTEKGPPIPSRLSDLYRTVSLSHLNLAESLRIKLSYLNFESMNLLANKLAKFHEAMTVLVGTSEVSERKFMTCINEIQEPPGNPSAEKDVVFRTVLKWIKENYDKSVISQASAILS